MSNLEASGSEQRAYRRYPASRKAYLVCLGIAHRCRLIDIAQGGARIAAPGVDVSGGAFHLVDPGKRTVHLTRVVWQGDDQIGLQFITSKGFSTPAGGMNGVIQLVDQLGPWPREELARG
jgi:hypothetical protein